MGAVMALAMVGCGYRETVTYGNWPYRPRASGADPPVVTLWIEPGFSPPGPGTETVEAADASTGPVDEVSAAKVFSGRTDWSSLVASVFPAWAVPRAMDILYCESGGNPWATGSSGERGLFQIHPIHFDSTYDPLGNVRAAYRISRGGTDWSAWSCA